MGFIYLIVQVDISGVESWKIGVTKNNPNIRVKQLSTGNSNEIRLINFYESDNYKRIELQLHRTFASKQTQSKNEWFNLSESFIANFKEECKKKDELISFLQENNYFFK